MELDGREEGSFSREGTLASWCRARGLGGRSLLQSLVLRLPAERWGEGAYEGGGWSHMTAPVRLRRLLKGCSPGPLPQSCPRSDLRLKRTSSGDFQLYFAESPSSHVPMGSFSGREARSPSFLSPFPFLWVPWDSCEVSRVGQRGVSLVSSASFPSEASGMGSQRPNPRRRGADTADALRWVRRLARSRGAWSESSGGSRSPPPSSAVSLLRGLRGQPPPRAPRPPAAPQRSQPSITAVSRPHPPPSSGAASLAH